MPTFVHNSGGEKVKIDGKKVTRKMNLVSKCEDRILWTIPPKISHSDRRLISYSIGDTLHIIDLLDLKKYKWNPLGWSESDIKQLPSYIDAGANSNILSYYTITKDSKCYLLIEIGKYTVEYKNKIYSICDIVLVDYDISKDEWTLHEDILHDIHHIDTIYSHDTYQLAEWGGHLILLCSYREYSSDALEIYHKEIIEIYTDSREDLSTVVSLDPEIANLESAYLLSTTGDCLYFTAKGYVDSHTTSIFLFSYNPADHKFLKLSTLPAFTRFSHSKLIEYNQEILLLGTTSTLNHTDFPLDDRWMYSIDSNSWTQLSDMPESVSSWSQSQVRYASGPAIIYGATRSGIHLISSSTHYILHSTIYSEVKEGDNIG